MASPPSSDTAFKVPPFTPSHYLKDRLLSFTDFLLSNIEEWNHPHPHPHPLWPSPPPPLSFSGCDRFIKGRLPHRTAAIADSLSSNFSGAAPLPDACNHDDGHDHMQVDSLFNSQNVTRSGIDVAPAARMHGGDGSTAPANTHSETPDPSLNLVCSHLQSSESAHGSGPNNSPDLPRNDSGIDRTDGRSVDDYGCARLHDAESIEKLPSHDVLGILNGSSETMLAADENVGLRELVVANTQPDDLDNGFSAMDVVDKGLQAVSVEAPDDLEEGELSERLSDAELPIRMDKGNVDTEANIQKGSPFDASRLEAEMHRGFPCLPLVHQSSHSDASSPDNRVVESETDDEMNEPISLFVSRRRTQTLLKLANQNRSTPATISKPMKKRDSKKKRKSEEEQQVLEKALSTSNGKPERMKVLQEGSSRVAIPTDVNEGQRLLGLQTGSTQVSTQGILESVNNERMDGAMGMSSQGLVQQVHAEIGKPEMFSGLSSFVVDEGLRLPTFAAGNDGELASHKEAKKKKRGPLTEARKKKRQRAKHKASERKLAKLGICKLKFKPYIEKTEKKEKKPCSFYVQGKCSKGASCTFSHDVIPLTKSEVCKYFIMNCCLKGDDCPFSHNLSSFPCKYFHMRGRCMEGESCRFSHEPMSEEAKQEFLRKIEEEQKVRQGVSDGMGWVGSNLKKLTNVNTPLSDKPNSSKAKTPANGKEAFTGFMPAKLNDVNDYSKLNPAKKAAFIFSSGPSNVANKSGRKFPFSGNRYNTTEPSRDNGSLKGNQATGMESGGQLGMNFIATTEERRTKAEAFLQARLDESSRFLHGSRRATGLENNERLTGTLSSKPMALQMGHSSPIRVSSMSASCKPYAKPMDLQDSSFQRGHQESVSVENGAAVSESSPTLLDLLLRPHAKTLSKEPSRSHSMDTNMACMDSDSNMFLSRFLN